jgi:hypothetical protein
MQELGIFWYVPEWNMTGGYSGNRVTVGEQVKGKSRIDCLSGMSIDHKIE